MLDSLAMPSPCWEQVCDAISCLALSSTQSEQAFWFALSIFTRFSVALRQSLSRYFSIWPRTSSPMSFFCFGESAHGGLALRTFSQSSFLQRKCDTLSRKEKLENAE